MSEEEKKAIERLSIKATTSSIKAISYPNAIVMKKDIKTVLNIIDNQQREIKRQKENKEILYGVIAEMKENNSHTTKEIVEFVNSHYIHKDRIREIISKYVDIEEQLNYSSNELFGKELTNMIKELLEEK